MTLPADSVLRFPRGLIGFMGHREFTLIRLREESHNCWTASCANDANTMEAAVRAFANGIPVTPVVTITVSSSSALRLASRASLRMPTLPSREAASVAGS